MQTAKSLQLMDDNGINISPITNIESIYYEVTENNVVYRKFLYDNFPVYKNKFETHFQSLHLPST